MNVIAAVIAAVRYDLTPELIRDVAESVYFDWQVEIDQMCWSERESIDLEYKQDWLVDEFWFVLDRHFGVESNHAERLGRLSGDIAVELGEFILAS